MSIPEILLYVFCGFLAGVINTIAGSGSTFTLGLMMLFNVPLSLANGTNRIGLLVQGSINTWIYKKKGMLETKKIAFFLIPTLFGALIGAGIGVKLNPILLNITVAILMAGIFCVYTFRNAIKKRFAKRKSRKTRSSLIICLFLLMGIYGGFIQIGIGLVMTVVFSIITNLNYLKFNGIKNLIIFVYSIPITFIYAYQNKVIWSIALFLTLGQFIGAYLCSKWSLKSKNIQRPIGYAIQIMILVVIVKAMYTVFI